MPAPRRVFVVPIYLAVEASCADAASEAISEGLRGLMIHGAVLDWQLARTADGHGYVRPVQVAMTLNEAEDEATDKQAAYEAAINPLTTET